MGSADVPPDGDRTDDNAIQNAFREYAAAHKNADPRALAQQFLASLSQAQLQSMIGDQARAIRRASEAFRKRAGEHSEQLSGEN